MVSFVNSARFDRANRLWNSGQVEEAASEFNAMAIEADHPDVKAGLLVNEHKCYCQIGLLDKASHVMREIRKLSVREDSVRMMIDIGDACMLTQLGRIEEGVSLFDRVLHLYRKDLQQSEFRSLYDEIRHRRGFALTTLNRYGEAATALEEASTFETLSDEDLQATYFSLGICYAALLKVDLAKEAYLRALQFNFRNATEGETRFRIAVVYFSTGSFAQAKHHLEAALQLPDDALSSQLRMHIYQQLVYTCHHLGEIEQERKYSKLLRTF